MTTQIVLADADAYIVAASPLLVDDLSILVRLRAQEQAVIGASSAYAPATGAIAEAQQVIAAIRHGRQLVAEAVADALGADVLASQVLGTYRASGRTYEGDVDPTDLSDLLRNGAVPIDGIHGDPGRGSAADPVDTATGAMWRRDHDVVVRAVGRPLDITRTWTSRLPGAGVFGSGWRSTFDVRLVRAGDTAVLHTEDGSALRHVRTADGWAGPAWSTTTLRDDDTGGGTLALLADGTRWRFDEDGLLVAITDEEGRGWSITRGPDAIRCTSTCGRRVDVVLEDGRAVRLDAPAGTWRYTHAGGLLQRVAHPDREVVHTYDDHGHMVAVHRDGQLLVTTDFDADGRVVGQVDVHGGRWALRYHDGATEVLEPDGSTTVDRHGPDGRLLAQHRNGAPVGRPVRVGVADVAGGRLRADLLDALGGPLSASPVTAVTAVDAHGRPAAVRTEDATTTMTWDESDRLAAARGVDGVGIERTTTRRETPEGDVRSFVQGGVEGTVVRDRLGDVVGWGVGVHRWVLERDELRRPVALTAPDGGRTTWAWSHDGRLLARRGPLGDTVVDWDAKGRLTAVRGPGRQAVLRHGPDGVRSVDVGGGEVTLARDERGRIREVRGDGVSARLRHRPDGSIEVREPNGSTTIVEPGGPGRRSRRTPTGAPAVTVDRRGARPAVWADDIGLLPLAPVDGGRTEHGPGGDVVVDVDAGRRRVTSTLPCGVRTEARYGPSGLLEAQAATDGRGQTLFAEHLVHDTAGRVITWVHDDVTWTVGRDAVGRLTSVVGDDGRRWAAELDLAGRTLRREAPAGTTTLVRDEGGQLVEVRGPAGTRRIEHDAAGRVVADGAWRFRWNALDKLVEAVDDAAGVRIEHDLDVRGLRQATRTWVDGALVRDLRWSWDTRGRVPRPLLVVDEVSGRRALARYDASGYPCAVVDPDDPSRDRWLVTDHLGTPRVELDADGAVLVRHEVDPFGATTDAPRPGEGPLLRFGFAGALVDDVTGHLHLIARQLDPTTGRFLTVDPIATPAGVHAQDPYGWCDGRPLDLRDPDGRFGISLPNPFEWVADTYDRFEDELDTVATVVAVAAVAVVLAPVVLPAAAMTATVAAGLATAGTALTVTGVALSGMSLVDNVGEGNHGDAAWDVAALALTPVSFGSSSRFMSAADDVVRGTQHTADDVVRIADSAFAILMEGVNEVRGHSPTP